MNFKIGIRTKKIKITSDPQGWEKWQGPWGITSDIPIPIPEDWGKSYLSASPGFKTQTQLHGKTIALFLKNKKLN